MSHSHSSHYRRLFPLVVGVSGLNEPTDKSVARSAVKEKQVQNASQRFPKSGKMQLSSANLDKIIGIFIDEPIKIIERYIEEMYIKVCTYAQTHKN